MKRRANLGEGPATFDRLVELETDECIVWPFGGTRQGYGLVHINGVKRYTHRLALERRVGPPPSPTMQAAHGPCHNPTCMNYRHLRWATGSENLADRLRDGTDDRGANNVNAKLSAEDVIAIRSSTERVSVLARRYGVSHTAISFVRSGRTYRNVEVAA